MDFKYLTACFLLLLAGLVSSQIAVNVLYQDNQCKQPVLYQYQPSGCSNQYNVILEEYNFDYDGYWRQSCNSGDSKIGIQLCDDDSSCSNCRTTLTFPTNTCVVVEDSYIYQHQTFSCITKVPATVNSALRVAAWESNQCLVNNWDTAYLFDVALGCLANYAYQDDEPYFAAPTSVNLTCNNFFFFADFCWDSPQRMCPSQNCTFDVGMKLGCWDIFDEGAFWLNCNANPPKDGEVVEYDEPVPAQKGFDVDLLKMIVSNNPVLNHIKTFMERVKARAIHHPSTIVAKEEQEEATFSPID